MYRHVVIFALVAASISVSQRAAGETNWSMDVGLRWFKHSAEGGPNEIGFNRVFDRWERINQDGSAYSVSKYQALEPAYFTMNWGVDFMFRYRKYLMLKLGYDYSDSLGIGGKGRISYTDNETGTQYSERKEFGFQIHQVNFFFGPSVPVEDRAEIYLGFSPMSPTWVAYQEKYTLEVDGEVVRHYDDEWKGFFGGCRALFGIQVRVVAGLKLGAEAVFAFLNYTQLESGELTDYSFRFPLMKWNFAIRYELF